MTTKIKSGVIAAGAVDANALSDNSITIAHLNCSDGTNGQVLTTNGSGTLSFTDMTGGVDGIVSSADATAITIDSSEKVGLNKVPSTWHLDVNSSDVYVASFDGSNDKGVIINSQTDSGDIIGYSNSTSTYNPLNIRGATGVGLYIDTSNNVGIGTASPGAILDVKRNTNTVNNLDSLGFDVAGLIGNAGSNPGNHYSSGLRIYQGSGTVGSGLGVLHLGADNGTATAANTYTAQIIAPSGMTGGIKLSAVDSSGAIKFNTGGNTE